MELVKIKKAADKIEAEMEIVKICWENGGVMVLVMYEEKLEVDRWSWLV